ncbi:MAG: DegT/DnrJ/EryC1/StrS family aminotransferase [Saprospiraceae bacterium]|nr:DegT/DnrJ/EryC1/StrS family aminotransferase [Saprospiraceae bacterium]
MQEPIHMVDLVKQYQHIQKEIDEAILNVVRSSRYIKGPQVDAFEDELAQYLDVKHVISCANGTDALQIALMAIGLKPGDEVIIPSFTYVATAEVIGLLQFVPVMIDVDKDTFNVTGELIEAAITDKTRAIVPVHLFGQSAPMDEVMAVARKHDLFVVEDNAQAIGATYHSDSGKSAKTGTIGDIGCTSFFPSKNLGCFGDGGALFTNDDVLAAKIRMIANHGQSRQYYHDLLGVNSRLDAIQAAVLRIKLKHLDHYCGMRARAADSYDDMFYDHRHIITPYRVDYSTHVFHQYTLQVPPADRDSLREHLAALDIPSMIYYPVPLYKQKAYTPYWEAGKELENTETLCASVISIPVHTEMNKKLLDYIGEGVLSYFG